MTEVLAVKFDSVQEVGYVRPDRSYKEGQRLIVKHNKAPHLAVVMAPSRQVEEQYLPKEFDQIIGLASERDLSENARNEALARDKRQAVLDLIAAHQLPMKLVSISYPLDRKQVLITYTASHRVDFRDLLKDLAKLFRARIELRQINSREEAKVYGGLGVCGRPLCCSSFLGDFPTVSIKMVKNQQLSLNNNKNTGLCGRLLCCLSYEEEFYRESQKRFPDLGQTVETKDGRGQIAGINILSDTVKVRLEDTKHQLIYPLEEVTFHV